MSRDLSLSVLDQSPVRRGGTAAQALRETVELAQAAERVGYRRYWVAEHHNAGGFAGTAPEILIGQIAAHTSTIRVGSGGVMLSHYAALKVAESFSMLSAFYPGRIDVGIGRAPGSDRKTALALAYPRAMADIDTFPHQVEDLVGYLSGELPDGHPFAGIAAQPGPPPATAPDIWLLGSSDYSARLAAALGLPFAFADFFGNAGDIGPRVAQLYRRYFQPSPHLQEPRLTVAAHVICAETAERAHHIAASVRLAIARLRAEGASGPLLPPDDAENALQGVGAETFTKYFIEGSPAMVREGLISVAERYGTDDLTIATNCYSFEDRVRSYQLVAEAVTAAPTLR